MSISAALTSLLTASCLLGIAPPLAFAQERGCSPVPGKHPPDANADVLAGDYHLTIVGTEGKAKGKMVSGDLKLWAPPDSFRYMRQLDGTRSPHVTTPLIGSTEIRLEDVGAVGDGSWSATEPQAPGVAVQEHHGSYQGQPFAQVLLRLGSEGNRRGVLRFDGPYNVLYIDRLADSGFYGRFDASLGYTTYRAEGFFCALRKH